MEVEVMLLVSEFDHLLEEILDLNVGRLLLKANGFLLIVSVCGFEVSAGLNPLLISCE